MKDLGYSLISLTCRGIRVSYVGDKIFEILSINWCFEVPILNDYQHIFRRMEQQILKCMCVHRRESLHRKMVSFTKW